MAASAPSCAVRLRRAARRGAACLSDEARDRVQGYVRAQRGEDGGYLGRHGSTDLYYSFFALACLDALGQPSDWHRSASYLDSFGDGRDLDLAHLSCLTRSRALAAQRPSRAAASLARLDEFLAPGGGYRRTRSSEAGSIAATFVARLAYDDLVQPLPTAARLDDCLASRACADGSWADVPGLASGTTTVTAAVVLMHAATGRAADHAAAWLAARCAPAGGFLSSPSAPVPDLLSTAAAVVALEALDVSRTAVAQSTRRFVEAMWNDDGGFRGYAVDPKSDCEFTYYALVALGALGEGRS